MVATGRHVELVEGENLRLQDWVDGFGHAVVRAVNSDIGLRGPKGIGERALLATHEHDRAG